jgi:hypothetical protein
MTPQSLTPPWHHTSPKGLIVPEHLDEPLLFDPVGHSEPPGGPAWSEYGAWLWPHELFLWGPGFEKPAIMSRFVVLADRHPVLSLAAMLWCVPIIEHGGGVILCARTAAALEHAVALLQPMIGGAGHA